MLTFVPLIKGPGNVPPARTVLDACKTDVCDEPGQSLRAIKAIWRDVSIDDGEVSDRSNGRKCRVGYGQ